MASCELRQGWNQGAEANFLPALVSVGALEDSGEKMLCIYAKLHDLDIGNAAVARNERTWELGDVFEIFLAPTGGNSYFEFHVTPENQVLECEFPLPRNLNAPLPLLDEPLIQSWTNVSEGQWEVLARLPLGQLGASEARQWKFSFSRYDGGPGRAPILSSSSPHLKVDFHRRDEWGELVLPGW